MTSKTSSARCAVSGIIQSAFPSQVSNFLGSASGVVGSGVSTVKKWISGGGATEGGLVFFDPPPFTGTLTASDPQGFTQATGGFSLYVPASDDTDSAGRIIIQGGVDIATGLPEVLTLVAPGSWSVADVFSTIVSSLYYGKNIPDATATGQVLLAMGLPSTVALSSYDATVATISADANGPAVLAAQAKLEDTIAMVAALFRSPSNQAASPCADRHRGRGHRGGGRRRQVPHQLRQLVGDHDADPGGRIEHLDDAQLGAGLGSRGRDRRREPAG